jgi:hypothetical protein
MPVYCARRGVFRGPDCASLGLSCSAGSCIGSGAACTPGSFPREGYVFYDGVRCDGDALITCANGNEHRLACSSVAEGFSCHTLNGTSFCGLAAECVPAEPGAGNGPDATCEGNNVVFCNAGRIDRIDCTSLGFERCDATNSYGCLPNFAQQ